MRLLDIAHGNHRSWFNSYKLKYASVLRIGPPAAFKSNVTCRYSLGSGPRNSGMNDGDKFIPRMYNSQYGADGGGYAVTPDLSAIEKHGQPSLRCMRESQQNTAGS